jgi:biopolymer transport protein ExbD
MIKRHKRYSSLSEVNITNLVDVTLVLLIIFILVAPSIKEGLEVDLPETTTHTNISDEDSILITLGKNQEILMNNRPYSIDAVGELLESAYGTNPKVSVLLKADGAVPYKSVVEIMDLVRSTGITRLGMITEPAISKK